MSDPTHTTNDPVDSATGDGKPLSQVERVVLLADRQIKARDEGFAALLEAEPLALLPVGTVRLIEHILQLIATAEAPRPRVDLFVSREAQSFRELVGDGARWGLEVATHPSTGAEPLETLLQRLDTESSSTLVLEVRGLVDLEAAELLRSRDDSTAFTDQNGQPIGAWFAHGATPPEELSQREQWPSEIVDGHFLALDSTPSFHEANLRFCRRDVENLLIPGHEIAVGVLSGRQSRTELSSIQNVPVLIGSRCRINRSAEILGSVVLSDDSVIDRGAQLQNAVVLPNTYVGELTAIQDAVVSGNLLIHLDSCVPVRVTDAFLLSDLRQSNLSNDFEGVAHRLGALLLAVLNLPFFLVGLLWAVLTNPTKPLRRDTLISNRRDPSGGRREFTLTRLRGCGLLLGALPPLLGVVRGHLRLVGVSALRPEAFSFDPEPWQELRQNSAAGLIGPTQLLVRADAPSEERSLSDAVYASQRTWLTDLGWIFRVVRHLFGHWAPVDEAPTAGHDDSISTSHDPAATQP